MLVGQEIRKTKIVATIGPASDSPEILREMIQAGLNVARLNLSHGTLEEQRSRLQKIRRAADELGAYVAVMVDTRGPEVRTGFLKVDQVELVADNEFSLYTHDKPGDETGVSISFKKLPREVSKGATILIDDGAIELRVTETAPDRIRCVVVHGGVLKQRKSVNVPDVQLSISAISPECREETVKELKFAAENEVDYIAASFIQCDDDLNAMRQILQEYNVDIPIIAKIENKAGVANLDAIVAAADGIMVARGDMGVELPLAEVPGTQKKIIRTTVSNGKPVITATQMLASMETNPRPTRAEASDVANAILDGTSAVMLSGETAVGRYPVEAVSTMAILAYRAEQHLKEYGFLQKILPHPSNVVTEAVSQAAVAMAGQLNAAAIFSLTTTGFTSRLVSKHRPSCAILAITASKQVACKHAINWGVLPIVCQESSDDEEKIRVGIEKAKALGYIKSNDVIVATAGSNQRAGGTDLIRVITLD